MRLKWNFRHIRAFPYPALDGLRLPNGRSPYSFDCNLRGTAADAAAGRLDVKPVRIFRFDEIREAHRVMEANEAQGKMVVVHD